MLYDRTQTSARIVVRNKSDLDVPLVRWPILRLPIVLT
jgi:hypothetical protein